MSHNDLMLSGAAQLGISLTQSQLGQFELYQQLLNEWNQRINLTSICEIEQIQKRHFLDSLTCILVTGDLSGKSLVDVGFGAGFPGLPLKICFPSLRLTLIESIQKKTSFLQMVVQELGLRNVTILSARAEDLGHSAEYREMYDWAVARAVAPLRILVEYLFPFTRIDGHILAQKGKNAAEELAQAKNALSQLGGGQAELLPVELFGEDHRAFLVKVQKVAITPEQYPRRAGVPAKRPL